MNFNHVTVKHSEKAVIAKTDISQSDFKLLRN